MSKGTEIKSNTANMEKGFTYMYILPWTTLGRPKNNHWALGLLVGRSGGSLAKMTNQNCNIRVAGQKYSSPSELHVWERRF